MNLPSLKTNEHKDEIRKPNERMVDRYTYFQLELKKN